MSSPTKPLCLLALVVIVTTAASAAAVNVNKIKMNKPLPGSCLMAASTLCANADTNAMRCLTKLAIKKDARVPSACAEALMGGVTMYPRRLNQASRAKRMSRMLNEGGGNCVTGNSCVTGATVRHQRCNDVANGCGACPHGTVTVPTNRASSTVVTSAANTNNIACSDVCCKNDNAGPVCCISWVRDSGISVYCDASSSFCNPTA